MTGRQWTAEEHARLFDVIPTGIAVIDRDYRVVDQNPAFSQLFGEALGRTCHEVCRGRTRPCRGCPAGDVFQDGVERAIEQSSFDRDGRDLHYLAQFAPIRNDQSGEIRFVATIISDVSATKRLQREYQTLFEKVPCYVVVLNRDYRVVKANERFRQVFGEPMGQHCYKVLKRRAEPCGDCPMEKTFADGQSHSSRHEGIAQDGAPTHYAVSTAPLLQRNGEISHVIEMALDLTQTHELEQELGHAELLRQALVENAFDPIVVLDPEQRVELVNQAAVDLWGYPREDLVGHAPPSGMIPASLASVITGSADRLRAADAMTRGAATEDVPVRLAAVGLTTHGRREGTAVFAQDLRPILQLEHDKLEAERLAAVGQTVAGLAHGIKNILSGIEGGMYVTSSGLRKGNDERVRQGWGMLERNIGRISALAKSLLAFARGDPCTPKLINPVEIAREAVALYSEGARAGGIDLSLDAPEEVREAWMDPDGLHSCLTNLISNAIDACQVSDKPGCRITVRVVEENDVIVVEVEDTGCGMDYQVKQKAFTSFFTTKGAGGTGLGLLVTRKIVQQHGGSITLTSKEGAGTTSTLRFPRARLPQPPKEGSHD